MTIPAPLLTEMRGLNRVHATVEIDIDGTTYFYSAGSAVGSESIGPHHPYIESMSDFASQGNWSEFSLQIPSPSIETFDHDRVLQKLIGGPAKGKIKGSAVRCWRRSNHVPAASHYQFFGGVVTEFGMTRSRVYRFGLAPDTRVLEGQPKIPFLTRADFPNAPAEFIDRPLWIVYGIHSSSGVEGAKGMIQCLPTQVDAAGDCQEWLVSYGQSTGIQRLFRGTSQSDAIEDTANWAFYPLERGGHRYQMAHYSGPNPKPVPEDYIAVDMHGLFQDGPVALTPVISNPAACIRNFLAHFAYGTGDVRSSVAAYETETGKPISTDVLDLAEAYFTARGDKMAAVIRADEKVLDVFNRWCDDFNAGPFFDDAWKIAAIPEDEAATEIYFEDRHVRQDVRAALGELQMDNSRASGVTEIEVNYLLADSLGSLTAEGIVSDPTATSKIRDTFDLEYGKAEAF
jgi:hypothetical protein